MRDEISNPSHYGGASNPYEAIKVIEAWGLGFALGNALKYISRAGKKSGASFVDDLKKARWYLDREITRSECQSIAREREERAAFGGKTRAELMTAFFDARTREGEALLNKDFERAAKEKKAASEALGEIERLF